MFEGSAHHDRGYFQPLQAAGAVLNGSTNTDRTNYWEVVPTGALELALVARVRPDGLSAAGADRCEVHEPARRGPQRAPPELREPPLRPCRHGHGGGALSERASVSLADHRIGRRPARDDARRGPRVLRAALSPGQRLAGDRRRGVGRRGVQRSPIATSARSRRGRRCTHVNGYAALRDGAAPAARGSRRAAAALPGVALAARCSRRATPSSIWWPICSPAARPRVCIVGSSTRCGWRPKWRRSSSRARRPASSRSSRPPRRATRSRKSSAR